MTIQIELKAARARSGLSIRRLAAAAGLSPDTVQGAETGRKVPSPITLAKLAKCLDLDLKGLLESAGREP